MPLITGALALGSALTAGLGTVATAAGTAAAAAGTGALGATSALGWGLGTTVATAGGATGLGAGSLAGLATAGEIASVASGLGTVGSLASTGLQYRASAQAADEQRKQEGLRRRQMELESARAQREVIRQTQIARATGLNAAAQSGGELAGSSAYGGILGQNTTNESFQLRSIRENEAIGNALFDSNIRESQASSQASLFGSLADAGGVLTKNNLQIGRIGQTALGRGATIFG